MKNIKPLLKYFKPYKWRILFISLIIFLTSLCYIFSGYLNGRAIESVTLGSLNMALKYLLIYFFLFATVEIINRIAYYFLGKLQIQISRRIGYDTYQKVMFLPSYAFEEMSSGEIINRASNDTEAIVGSVDRLLSILSNVVSSLIILVYIFFNSYIIGFQILLFILIYAFIVRKYSKLFKKVREDVKKESDKLTSLTNESVRGVREIKTLGIVGNLFHKIGDIIRSLYDKTIDEYKAYRNYDLISDFLKTLLECSCFITCAILTCNGYITITFFVAMTYYIYRYTWVIENVTEFSKTFQSLNVAMGRINEILNNEKYEDVSYGDTTLKKSQGVIEFKKVYFNYKNEDELLKNFNITFTPNKKIAIVGSSGEGKSTLFNLITRLFEPIKGEILLDGINIKDLDEKSLRDNISIIRQEPFIFNRTIKENFTILNPKVTLSEIRKYCKIAYIDDYIMSLPKKYNTLLGEGGVNLSGGQKQRLAIARTLLKKTQVVLFDEATSALDNESQNYIKKAIDNLAKDHTVIIVAHRLSTIIDADEIYVIKSGKVFAKGTHNELIENCSFYKKLYLNEDIK